MPTDAVRRAQSRRWGPMVSRVLESNRFYGQKLGPLFTAASPPSFRRLSELPFTTKAELAADQDAFPPYGSNLTGPIESYVRMHETSGTTGRPLRWLDDAASWRWLLGCWREVYRSAGLGPGDRVLVAFAFGPFLGFWAAFEAAQELGALAISGGGLSSEQRLQTAIEHRVTVLVSTPTYALRLAELARAAGIDLAASPVRLTLHAGEPGASIANVRSRIETAWGARCFDHAGATEVGPWGYGCGSGGAMHIHETEFVAEVVDPETGELATASDGYRAGELVLTNLGRIGSPVIRYRTGDLVRLSTRPCRCGRDTATIDGGVLGRTDDMVIVRGINVYPATIEDLVRGFDEVVEFEVELRRVKEMAELVLRLEIRENRPGEVADRMRRELGRQLPLRIRVETVAVGTLARQELKARRFKVAP